MKEEKPKQGKPVKEKKQEEEEDLPPAPKAKDPYAGLPKRLFKMSGYFPLV